MINISSDPILGNLVISDKFNISAGTFSSDATPFLSSIGEEYILSFPVLLPIILVVIHLSKQAIDGIEWAGLGFDFLVILTALNILTIALSFILFPYLWRD